MTNNELEILPWDPNESFQEYVARKGAEPDECLECISRDMQGFDPLPGKHSTHNF